MTYSRVITQALLLLGLSLASLCHMTQAHSANEMDGSMYDQVGAPRERRNFVVNPAKKWTSKVIPYTFSAYPVITEDVKRDIMEAMKEIASNTRSGDKDCISFRPRKPSDYDYMELGVWRCGTVVGNQGSKNRQVGLRCQGVAEMIRVLLTSLGFYSEQQRPDRDSFVEYRKQNLRFAYQQYYFYKQTNASLDTLGTAYDYSSIMNLGSFEYSRDEDNLPTTIAKAGYRGRSVPSLLRRNLYMSEQDVLRVQRAYQCTEDTTHVLKPDYLIQCPSEDNKCGLTQDQTDDFDWQIGQDANHPYALIVAKGNGGKTASLSTKEFPAGSYCVHLSIYPFGNNNGGTLILKHKSQGIPQTFDDVIVSPHKDAWFTVQLPSSYIPLPFTMILEYTVASGATTNFAIDNFTLEQGLDCDRR